MGAGAYGAAYALQELLTIKSRRRDRPREGLRGHRQGENIPEPGIPGSFKVLIKEMQSCASTWRCCPRTACPSRCVTDEDVFRAAEELGIDLSRREPSSVEEVADGASADLERSRSAGPRTPVSDPKTLQP
ncbi:hypothetical protein LV779_22355 [Streptomyces thinghirensis]|nr:hypothetical protein [Streptomyces thinghirensis]